MSEKKKRPWSCLALLFALPALVLFPTCACGVVLASLAGPEPVGSNVVVDVKLAGSLSEHAGTPRLSNLLQLENTLTLADHRVLLTEAKDNPGIRGVLLTVEPVSYGWASIEELHGLVRAVRDAGKPVIAFLAGDFIDEKQLALAAAADQVFVTPNAGFLINGLSSEVMFLRGTLDKLHIRAHSLAMKEFKSASETFVRDEMSAPSREALTFVLRGIEARVRAMLTDLRAIDDDGLAEVYARGLLSGAEAKDAGLVDALGDRAAALAALREQCGGGSPPSVSSSKRVLRARRTASLGVTGPHVAVVYGEGAISSSSAASPASDGISGPRLARAIRKATDDDDVRAIVLRVNSPGGAVVGSDRVYAAVRAAKEKKPVVVSMGDVAASGGYWISMGANEIVAAPTTITGSIGVVFTIFDLSGFAAWVGASIEQVRVGENATMFDGLSGLSAHEKERALSWMTQTYDDFVRKVAEGRGLDVDKAESLAHGRIWTGAQAKERGLVDHLGGLGVALDRARALAGDDSLPARDAREQGAWFEEILRSLGEARGVVRALSALSGLVVDDEAALIERVRAEYGGPRVEALAPALVIR